MAVQTAEKFLEFLGKSHSVRNQLMISDRSNLDELVAFARGKGFVFTRVDLEAAMKSATFQFKFVADD